MTTVERVRNYDGETRVRLTMADGKYIEIIPGELPYLWVGGKDYYSSTKPPSKQALREFAKEIIKAVGK